MDILKCYKTLGLPPDATDEETKHAYRKLVNHWHPDRFARDDALHQLAEEQLKLLNIAYAEIQRHQSTRPRRYRANRATVPRSAASRRAAPGFRPSRPPVMGQVPAVLNRLTRKFRQMLSNWVSTPPRPVRAGKPAGRPAAPHSARGKRGTVRSGHRKNFDQIFNEVAGPDAAHLRKTAARRKHGHRKTTAPKRPATDPGNPAGRGKKDDNSRVVTPVARIRRVGKIRRV